MTAPTTEPLVLAWSGHRSPRFKSLKPSRADIDLSKTSPPVDGLSPTPNWVRRYVQTQAALARGDVDAAWDLMKDVPKTSAFQNLRAILWARMDDISRQERADVRIPALKDGVRIAPIRSGIALTEILRASGRGSDALGVIKKVLRIAPLHADVRAEYLRTLIAVDRINLARTEFRSALALQTDPCALFDVERHLYTSDTRQRNDLIARMTQCGRPYEAARLLRRWHRPLDALELLKTNNLTDAEARLEKARSLLALGQVDKARKAIGHPETFALKQLAIDFEQSCLDEHDDASAIRNLVGQFITEKVQLIFLPADRAGLLSDICIETAKRSYETLKCAENTS